MRVTFHITGVVSKCQAGHKTKRRGSEPHRFPYGTGRMPFFLFYAILTINFMIEKMMR
jgi:hypothetical protein